MNWQEGSTWRGGVRVLAGLAAVVVLFATGDAESAQETMGEATRTLNETGALLTLVFGEGIKGLIGLLKGDRP